MSPCRRLLWCSIVSTLALVVTLPGTCESAALGQVEPRASYWPGMWQFHRDADTDDDYDEDAGSTDKRGYYWPGMWQFGRDRKQTDKRGYYWPGMWQFARDRKQTDKRGYYWPGMWQFGRDRKQTEKRGYYWPGMWQFEQRAPVLAPGKRSYEYYWLGKACGETGDPDACGILNGMYYY